jgi:hypothetical protein
VLHRAASFGEDSVSAPVTPEGRFDGRITDLMAEADRAFRMAKVLAAGGFPEEAPALLAKALAKAAAGRLAECGELPAATSSAADADIRRLVERQVMPTETLDLLDATHPSTGRPDAATVAQLVATAERVLAMSLSKDLKAAA